MSISILSAHVLNVLTYAFDLAYCEYDLLIKLNSFNL